MQKRHYVAWFGAWLAVTIIAALITPSKHGHGTHQQLGLPPCGSVLMFQRPCPGCGLTTSFTATVQGQFKHAWESNPFGPVFYGIFTITAWLALYGFIAHRRVNSDGPVYRWTLIGLISAFMVWGIWRFATETIPVSEVLATDTSTRQRE